MQASAGPLRVSVSGRHLTTPHGAPFFWLGDTAWELFHRLTLEEADHYFGIRAKQRFNVVQAVALAEEDGLRVPNRGGHLPFHGEDPGRPNEPYWAHVDAVVDLAHAHGLIIAMLPTWGDKVVPGMWGKGPVVFSADNARNFGQFLGERYAACENVIWVLGGDRPVDGFETVWAEMAAGLHEKSPFLTTCHPMGGRSSSEEIHDAAWLDMNMLQTGHGRTLDRIARMIDRAWDREPAKPVLDGEPIYEWHPVDFNHANGISDAADVRSATAQGVFSGGCGTTYGCHTVWQMAQDRFPGVNRPIGHWRDALDIEGANGMHHLRDFAERTALVTWSPSYGVTLDASGHRARVSPDGARAAVYVTDGRHPVTLGRVWRETSAEWVDLASGETHPVERRGTDLIPPKNSSKLNDGVLLVTKLQKFESPDARYPV